MALVLTFSLVGLTADKYDRIVDWLKNDDAGSPQGRLYHVCFGDPNNLTISDIWESRASFERFGEVMSPMLKDLGIEPVEPEEFGVHNILEGTQIKTATR